MLQNMVADVAMRNTESENDGFFSQNRCSFHKKFKSDKNFQKQLEKDGISKELFHQTLDFGEDQNALDSWTERILDFLRSNVLHLVLGALVIIDAGIVIAEIILEINYMKGVKESLDEQLRVTIQFISDVFCNNLRHLELSTSTTSSAQLINNAQTIIQHLGILDIRCFPKNTSYPSYINSLNKSSTESIVPNVSSLQRNTSCLLQDGRPRVYDQPAHSSSHQLHNISHVLHYTSIGILSIFVVEVSIKILCLRKEFLNEKYEVIDAIVIFMSFVADIVFVYAASQEISVMVLFLLWRIIRVINGLMMTQKQRDEFRIQLIKKLRKDAEKKLEECRDDNDMQNKYISKLLKLCQDNNISEEQISSCCPRTVAAPKEVTNNAVKHMAVRSMGIFSNIAGAQHRKSISMLNSSIGGAPSLSALSTLTLDSQAQAAGAGSAATKRQTFSATTGTTTGDPGGMSLSRASPFHKPRLSITLTNGFPGSVARRTTVQAQPVERSCRDVKASAAATYVDDADDNGVVVSSPDSASSPCSSSAVVTTLPQRPRAVSLTTATVVAPPPAVAQSLLNSESDSDHDAIWKMRHSPEKISNEQKKVG